MISIKGKTTIKSKTIVGPNISTGGLVLYLDAANPNSYRGEPTTNYIYHQNPRVDTSYSAVDLSSYGGTMVENHPGIIQAYKLNNSTFNAVYYNAGVGDPTNKQHAYWIYDNILKKPVVQMIDIIGSWQAKSFDSGMAAWSTYEYTVGTKYTISWNQYVTNTSKYVDVGVYTKNSSNTYNFWDGRSSGSATSRNTQINKWERVYHTYTVTSDWDQTIDYSSIYMYGHIGTRATIRISDVQLEFKDHPTHFLNELTRGITYTTGGGWCDLTSNGINATTNNITYDTDGGGSLVLNNTNGSLTFGHNSLLEPANITIISWINLLDRGDRHVLITKWLGWSFEIGGDRYPYFRINGSGVYDLRSTVPITWGSWVQIASTFDDVNNTRTIAINGVVNNSVTDTGSITYNQGSFNIPYTGNGLYGKGNIATLQIYNKVLSSDEILQNYNSQKSRFVL